MRACGIRNEEGLVGMEGLTKKDKIFLPLDYSRSKGLLFCFHVCVYLFIYLYAR